MSSVRAFELRHGRRSGIFASLARPLPSVAKVFLFAAFVAFGAEAAPVSERDFEESGTGRLTNRVERSMTRVRLRRYFRHGMLPQLIAFEACVRHGSVTRAAEELSLAQPTVSCLIRKLSETLGAPVTQMRDRRIEPTGLGRDVLALCHEVFASFERFDVKREGPSSASDPEGSGGGYDRHPPDLQGTSPWDSASPPDRRSRWKQRASRCPRAKPRPIETAGES
jgi:hypothetical protein